MDDQQLETQLSIAVCRVLAEGRACDPTAAIGAFDSAF